MASDTNATTDPQAVEVIEPEVASSPDPLGLGALMGGIDLGALMGSMGIELPDADAATLDDVLDELADLTARLDWLASAILLIQELLPAKFRPDLPAYPPPIEV